MIKHTILMVDDDALILNTLKQRFATWDIDVVTATNPEEAKAALEKFVPDVVMLDLLLTKDEGSQGILDYIKSQERLAHIVVLILTNLDKPELKRYLLAQGVKEYLIKGSMTLDDIYNKVLGYMEPKKNI